MSVHRRQRNHSDTWTETQTWRCTDTETWTKTQPQSERETRIDAANIRRCKKIQTNAEIDRDAQRHIDTAINSHRQTVTQARRHRHADTDTP